MIAGKTAIITGASSGIGRAISLALGRAGARCVLAARREAALQEVAEQIRQDGSEARVVPTDVTRESDLQALVASSVEAFGGLDILINNAGMFSRAAIAKLERSKLEATLQVNLVAPIMLTQACLPHLTKSGTGAVINIASISGIMGFPTGSAYCASKFGLVGFSEVLFEEVRDAGIKVCAICPGYVETPMTANYGLIESKMIAVDDVAMAVMDVLRMSPRSCPSRIVIRPQHSPYPK